MSPKIPGARYWQRLTVGNTAGSAASVLKYEAQGNGAAGAARRAAEDVPLEAQPE